MNSICWRLVDALSRMLASEEREAMRGDLTESGVNGGQALSDVLGLVVRRQAALWIDWRPWLALMGVVVPLGMLLSLVSRWWADGSAIHWWFYVNNWTGGYLESQGARRDLVQISASVILTYVTLACWSWTSGFVLGSLSRHTIRVNGTLFCLVIFGELVAPQPRNPASDAVFSLAFYGVWFPIILRILLVLFPALWGMRTGRRVGTLPLHHAVVWAIAVVTMTTSAARGLQFTAILGWWHIPARIYIDQVVQPSWKLRLLPLAVTWPVVYMVAAASWQRWRRKNVAAWS